MLTDRQTDQRPVKPALLGGVNKMFCDFSLRCKRHQLMGDVMNKFWLGLNCVARFPDAIVISPLASIWPAGGIRTQSNLVAALSE